MEFDKENYKVWKLPHPMLLHWVLNPGIALNELILGQRIPRIILIDRNSDAPLMKRQYIPCPECNALNDGRIWSRGNAFGHWFGYVCPECHGRIPCLWNAISVVLLAITFPLWIWLKIFGEERWLAREKRRALKSASGELPGEGEISWLQLGLTLGAVMAFIMVASEFLQGRFTPIHTLVQFAFWLGIGLIFGWLMKLFTGREE